MFYTASRDNLYASIFIGFLKLIKEDIFLISTKIISQIHGPRQDELLLPWYALLKENVWK